MAEILITGGAGSFGRTLSYALHQQGHSLRIFDLPSCDFSFAEQWKQVRIFHGDILAETLLMSRPSGRVGPPALGPATINRDPERKGKSIAPDGLCQ